MPSRFVRRGSAVAYPGGLENRCAFGHRGFESHPLRHLGKAPDSQTVSCGEMSELAEGARLEIVCGDQTSPRVRIPLSPPRNRVRGIEHKKQEPSDFFERSGGFFLMANLGPVDRCRRANYPVPRHALTHIPQMYWPTFLRYSCSWTKHRWKSCS